jgi:hypothetical protein
VRLAEPEDFDLAHKLRQWRDEGIVIFEGAVDASEIDSLLLDIEFLDRHRPDYDLEVEFRGQRLKLAQLERSALSDPGVKFNCLETISSAAQRLSLNRFVCRFLRHVFQEPVAVLQSLTFWRGSEQGVHLDYPWVNTQTKLPHLAASWIPLEDVHPDSGPLAYYPGSHKAGMIEPYDWGEGSLIQQGVDNDAAWKFVVYLRKQIEKKGLTQRIFLPKRGDVLIWHGQVLHEGTKIADPSRTRRSYVTHYTSLGAYPAEHKTTDACATSLNGGYVFVHPWSKPSPPLPSSH